MEPTLEPTASQAPAGNLIGIGELIRVSWQVTKTRWALFLGILAVPLVINLISIILIASRSAIGLVLVILCVIASIVFSVAGAAGMMDVANRSLTDSSATFTIKGQYSFGFKRFWSLIWVGILSGLTAVGAIALVAIVALVIGGLFAIVHLPLVLPILMSVAIIFSEVAVVVYIIFTQYALIVDDKRGINAIQESVKRVQGRWWKTFGRFVILGLIVIAFYIIIFAVQALLYKLAGISFWDVAQHKAISPLWLQLVTGVIGFLMYTVIAPFSLAYFVSIYRSLGQLGPVSATAKPLATRGQIIGLSVFGLVIMVAMVIFWIVSLLSVLLILGRSMQSNTLQVQQIQQIQQAMEHGSSTLPLQLQQ